MKPRPLRLLWVTSCCGFFNTYAKDLPVFSERQEEKEDNTLYWESCQKMPATWCRKSLK
jgi:hypothetical protein